MVSVAGKPIASGVADVTLGASAMRLQIWPAPPSRHCSGGSAPVQQGSEAQEAPRATHVLPHSGVVCGELGGELEKVASAEAPAPL